MKKIAFLSLVLISAFARNGFSESIIATESFVRSGLSTRVTNAELTSIVTAALSTKADLQAGAVAGHVATMGAGGQYVDSGTALSALATTSSVNTGLNTKLNLAGGTMAGAINMGNNKVTNLATPTNTTDATTKSYVDSFNTAPSWATLSGQNWDVPGWGASWQVTNDTSSVYGVAACLSSSSKSGTEPSSNASGQYCWCKISNVNGIESSGAWVYNSNLSNSNTCYSRCSSYCGYCVRYSSYGSCSRSALFSAL